MITKQCILHLWNPYGMYLSISAHACVHSNCKFLCDKSNFYDKSYTQYFQICSVVRTQMSFCHMIKKFMCFSDIAVLKLSSTNNRVAAMCNKKNECYHNMCGD